MKRKYEENKNSLGNNNTIDETKHLKRTLKLKKNYFMKFNNYNRTIFNELNKNNYSGAKINFPIIQYSYTINRENETKDKKNNSLNSFYTKKTQPLNLLPEFKRKNNIIKLQKRINNDVKFSNPFISNNISKHTNSSNYKSTSFTKREISLLDNPDSYLYFMFHTSRKAHHNKIKMKIINKDFSLNKHKEDIKKNKNEVFNQLNILHKEITFHEENKPNRKMFSTKTFMDMKINVI
jgi:hypothetical protein